MAKSSYPNGFTNGVTIRGIPVAVTNPGETFWVNSTAVLPVGGKSPSDNSPGTYLEPVSTIGAALDLCTASRGDIIICMPGHTEASVAAGGVALDVKGVALIGLGTGSLKPTINLTTLATATVTVTADDVSLFNFRIVSGLANQAIGLNVTGANFSVDSCEFMSSTAALGLLTSIQSSNTAFGLSVTNCLIQQESSIAGTAVTDVCSSGIQFDGDNTTIRNNVILGEFSVSGIYNVTTAAEGCVIMDNSIMNLSTAAAGGGISLKAACTGMIYRNHIVSMKTTTVAALVVNPNCAMSENYANNDNANSDIVIPVLAST